MLTTSLKAPKTKSKPWLFKAGNPGGPGRPHTAKGDEMVREFLERVNESDPQGRTNWQLVIQSMEAQALRGSVAAAHFLAERAYGKVKETHDVNVNQVPVFDFTNAIYTRRAAPAGMED